MYYSEKEWKERMAEKFVFIKENINILRQMTEKSLIKDK